MKIKAIGVVLNAKNFDLYNQLVTLYTYGKGGNYSSMDEAKQEAKYAYNVFFPDARYIPCEIDIDIEEYGFDNFDKINVLRN